MPSERGIYSHRLALKIHVFGLKVYWRIIVTTRSVNIGGANIGNTTRRSWGDKKCLPNFPVKALQRDCMEYGEKDVL